MVRLVIFHRFVRMFYLCFILTLEKMYSHIPVIIKILTDVFRAAG